MSKRKLRKRYLAVLAQAIAAGTTKLLEQDGNVWPVKVV